MRRFAITAIIVLFWSVVVSLFGYEAFRTRPITKTSTYQDIDANFQEHGRQLFYLQLRGDSSIVRLGIDTTGGSDGKHDTIYLSIKYDNYVPVPVIAEDVSVDVRRIGAVVLSDSSFEVTTSAANAPYYWITIGQVQ